LDADVSVSAPRPLRSASHGNARHYPQRATAGDPRSLLREGPSNDTSALSGVNARSRPPAHAPRDFSFALSRGATQRHIGACRTFHFSFISDSHATSTMTRVRSTPVVWVLGGTEQL